MTDHKTGTREEWLAARLELLEAEKALTRRSDEVARSRQELPWVQIDKDYRFETGEGTASLVDLFRGRSQMLVYHFMLGPGWDEGCPTCSAIADGLRRQHFASRASRCRVRRGVARAARRARPLTSGAWDGTSVGSRRSAAVSTTTST